MSELSKRGFLTPTTLLQATNILLGTVGTSQVASLSAENINTDVEESLTRLGEALREVQEEGFSWNQELEYTIVPNASGEIVLPSNAIKATQLYSDGTSTKRLQWRGRRLYDSRNHTFKISETVKVDMFVILDFEIIPEAARRYVTARAARRFSSNKMASTTLYKITKADEDEARLRMEQMSAEADPDSMLQNPHVRRTRRGKV